MNTRKKIRILAFGLWMGSFAGAAAFADGPSDPLPPEVPAEKIVPAEKDLDIAPAILKRCEFTLSYEPLLPTAAEKKVPWAGLDLQTCTVVVTDRAGKEGEAIGVHPGADAIAPWQVRVRQAYLGTNQGEAASVKDAAFEQLDAVNDNLAFVPDKEFDVDGKMGPGGVDFYSPALMEWARMYDPEHHVFIPLGQTYVIKTQNGAYAKLQVVQYLVNGGGYEKDPQKEGSFAWNSRLGAADGKVRVVLRTVANLIAGDKRLK